MTINLTDPANHPANGPLTVERITRVRDELQRSIQYQNGGDMAYVIADAIKGLEELLVEKEAAGKPVGNDELDQMIWKLERDGMNPKLLSLMRELLEVRRAKGEPVAVINGAREPVLYGENIGIAIGTHLYAAPPSPLVPDAYIRDERQRMMLNGKCEPKIGFAAGWNACRAAMLQAGNSPATPDGWVLVPEDPTHEMLEAGDAQFGTYDVYRRMIEAAPKEVG